MKKILAVCGFGVGSSMALKMQIEKALRELKICAEVDNTDVTSAPGMSADYIFTSPEFATQLSGSVTCPIIEVKQFMNYEEVLEASKKHLK